MEPRCPSLSGGVFGKVWSPPCPRLFDQLMSPSQVRGTSCEEAQGPELSPTEKEAAAAGGHAGGTAPAEPCHGGDMPRGAPCVGPAEHPAGSESAASGAHDELAGEDHRQVQRLGHGEDARCHIVLSGGPPRLRACHSAGFRKGDRLQSGLCASLKGFLGPQWPYETLEPQLQH